MRINYKLRKEGTARLERENFGSIYRILSRTEKIATPRYVVLRVVRPAKVYNDA